jgi:hypothetical protein
LFILADWQALMACLLSGLVCALPMFKSKIAAAATIGILAHGVLYPIRRLSRYSITPSAAASPNALPPLSTTAWISCIALSAASRGVSRDAGELPRTSHPPIVFGGQRITVQPVSPRRLV